MLPGRGVLARVEGYRVLAGNRELLEQEGVAIPGELGEWAEPLLSRATRWSIWRRTAGRRG